MRSDDLTLVITPAAWQWLIRQRGELSSLESNRDKWCETYAADMLRTVHQIGFVPAYMLDIGSGLGAIDVLMSKQGTFCTLIDAEDGVGACVKHDVPFCNRQAVVNFMNDNGVPRAAYQYIDPKNIWTVGQPVIYDLVVSLRSWCFHYAPGKYLQYVNRYTCPGSRILVDVRKDKPDWRAQLKANWEELEVLEEGNKYLRIEYRVRGRVQ